MADDKCACGKESTRGCHGIKDGEIFSEHPCDDCFNSRNKEDKDETTKTVQKK